MLVQNTNSAMSGMVGSISFNGQGAMMKPGMGLEAMHREVLAASGRNQQAFVRLIEACSSTVCSIALAIVRDVQASEDIAQEVFLAAWVGLEKLRNPESFLPWIRQLTRNRAHSWLRDHRSARQPVPRSERVLEATADQRPGAADQLLKAEELRQLEQVIDALPDEAREVVTLYYREGRSVRQVAELLGMSEVAVKQRMSRARTKMSEAMLERLGETLTRTAPSAAFTTAVAAALVSGAPSTAAAAVAVKTAAAADSSLLAKLSGMVGPTALGTVLGAMGVFMAVNRVTKGLALNAEEQLELARFKKIDLVASTAFPICIGLCILVQSAALMAITGLVFLPLNFAFHVVWLPRIVARAQAAERAQDPAAERRQRRSRLLNYLMYGTGFVVATATLVWVCLELAKG